MISSNFQIPEALIKNLEKKIVNKLDKVGLFYRIFSRIKTDISINRKLNEKEYSSEKQMQDLFGLRIVLYFNDDIEICEKVLSRLFTKVDESIDKPNSSTFKPTRTNIIYRLDDYVSDNIKEAITGKFIDNTFEIQLRTVFSEGWHEVEHDLRYKCKEEWSSYDDQSRTLNGLVATLETCDWSILRLFSDLAYSNYKDSNLIPMIRNKFRLRFINEPPLDSRVIAILEREKEVTKRLYRIEREQLLEKLSNIEIQIPLTFTNFIFICNHFFMDNAEIKALTPETFMILLSNKVSV